MTVTENELTSLPEAIREDMRAQYQSWEKNFPFLLEHVTLVTPKEYYNPYFSLKGVDLSGCDLRKINLNRVDLCETNFTDADLREGCLEFADLRGTIFTEARMAGTKITAYRMNGVDFRDVNLSDVKINTDCSNNYGGIYSETWVQVNEGTIFPDNTNNAWLLARYSAHESIITDSRKKVISFLKQINLQPQNFVTFCGQALLSCNEYNGRIFSTISAVGLPLPAKILVEDFPAWMGSILNDLGYSANTHSQSESSRDDQKNQEIMEECVAECQRDGSSCSTPSWVFANWCGSKLFDIGISIVAGVPCVDIGSTKTTRNSPIQDKTLIPLADFPKWMDSILKELTIYESGQAKSDWGPQYG